MNLRICAAVFTVLASLCASAQTKQKKLPKPSGLNFFSKDQDVQMGREYAQQVEKQLVVVNNKELTDYVNRVGQRLVDQGGLKESGFPFSFKVVQEPSINAFALPGGPMFVHTGLIQAADNEAQLAGVLAHELSHVVLRHGTNQASKAQLIQLPAMLAGGLAGGSLVGQLAQLGIGLGANSVLLKFSRSAESDADLLGAYTMARAGYNPVEMARFFEKLEAQMGSGANSKVATFFSDHPNPGNRVQSIEEQLPYMARGDYNTQVGDIGRAKALVGQLPAVAKPKAGPTQAAQPAGQGSSTQARVPKPVLQPVSQQFKAWQGKNVAITYPDNWIAQGDDNSLTIAPKEGLVSGQVGYGVMLNSAVPPSGRVNLGQDTAQLVQALAEHNPGLEMNGQPQRVTISGSSALVTRLTSVSPYENTQESDVLITIDRGNVLYYMVFVAPEQDYARLEPVFQQISRSLRFLR
jgi:predicted Zn-dependent protease